MPYLTPPSIPEGTVCRPLFIPASSEWLAIVSGAITELTKTWNWEQFGVSVEDTLAAVQVMVDAYYAQENECVNPNCPCPPIYRTGSLGQQQVSLDGMETWQDVALPPLPTPTPISGQSDQCLSARNAIEVVFQTYSVVIDEFNNGVTILVGLAALISTLALMIFYPPAVAIVWTFFVELWAVLEFLTAGDWTSGFTEEITCIVYNHISIVDGVYQADFEAMMAEIGDHLEDNQIWAAAYYIILAAGEYSFQQALQTRSIQSWDCSECEPPLEFIIYSEDDPSWTGTPCAHSGRGSLINTTGDTWQMTATQDVDTNWYVEIRRSDGAGFQGINGSVVSGATPTFVAANFQSLGGCNTGGWATTFSTSVVTILWAAASPFTIQFDLQAG